MNKTEKEELIEEIKSRISKDESKKVDEVELKTVEKRLDGLKEAVQRGRSVFVVIIIACSAVLFTIWNANFSRERTLAFDREGITLERAPTFNKKGDATDTPRRQEQAEPLNIYGMKTLVAEWYKSRSIQVNLLGIKVDVGDLSLIGSFSLVVLTIWYFYSQRQVNRLIRDLLTDAGSDDKGYNEKFRSLVFFGIAQNALFAKYKSLPTQPAAGQPGEQGRAIAENDLARSAERDIGPTSGEASKNSTPMTILWGVLFVICVPVVIFSPLIVFLALVPYLLYVGAMTVTILLVLLVIVLFRKKIRSSIRRVGKKFLTESDRADSRIISLEPAAEKSFSDRVVGFLFYLPFWTMMAIIVRDVLNLCMVSPLRGTNLPDLGHIGASLESYLLPSLAKYGVPIGLDILVQAYDRHLLPVFLATVFDGIAIVCAFYILILCEESVKFTDESVIRLNMFNQKMSGSG